MKLLKFNIHGDFAHFRKPYSNISRMTYQIPPRMTVAGMLAGILGMDRDSYYDIFDQDSLSVSVRPLTPIKTIRIPQNVVGTSDGDMDKLNNYGSGPTINILSPSSYKQRVFEHIIKPQYQIFIHIEENSLMNKLYKVLSQNKFTYTPSLGSARCIANISDVELVDTIRVKDSCKVQSPVTDSSSVSDVKDTTVVTEKITAEFDITEGSRGTKKRISSSYVQYMYDKSGNGLKVNPSESQRIFQIPSLETHIEMY